MIAWQSAAHEKQERTGWTEIEKRKKEMKKQKGFLCIKIMYIYVAI